MLKKLVALIAVITIISTDFFMLGTSLLTYATQVTNEIEGYPNIHFSTYFKDGENETKEITKSIKEKNIKIYAKIGINSDVDYLENVQIKLVNNNFNILSSNKGTLDGNTVKLDYIAAGSSTEIELNIEPIFEDKIASDMILKPRIEMSATYKNAEAPEGEEITATSELNIKYQPDESTEAELTADIITNKVLTINGKNQRVIQALIKSRLTNNDYPVNQTTLNVNIPNLSEAEPEIRILTIGKLATSGLTEINNKVIENGQLQITINNEIDENNQISWNKNAYDELIITYIYPETADANKVEITANSEIKLHSSGNTYTAKYTKGIENQELDNTILERTEAITTELYKGQLYANVDTQYETKTSIIATIVDTEKEISVQEKSDVFESKTGVCMNRSEALFFSFLFVFLSFPTAFSQEKTKQTAIRSAHSQTHENSKQYFQNLLEKSGSIDVYYRKLGEELRKRKTIREKVEFLSPFRKDPLNRLVLGRTPTHIGSQYLRSELTSRLEIEEETPELLFSLAFLVPRQESTYSDLRYKLLKKAFELAPGEPVIGFELGRAALERGNFEEAEELLRKYRPASSIAAEENDLAALYLISGRKEEALRLIRKESALPQTPKRIFSDQILLLRFGEIQAAEQLLKAGQSGLTEEQKSFLTAVRHLFEGKKKEAAPILLRLATPEKLRQENESNIHSLAQKRLRRKYPDYSFLSLARSRQKPITGFSVISRIRYPYSDTAENSLFLLLFLWGFSSKHLLPHLFLTQPLQLILYFYSCSLLYFTLPNMKKMIFIQIIFYVSIKQKRIIYNIYRLCIFLLIFIF